MKYPNQFNEGNPIYCPIVTHRICQVKFMGVDKLRIDEETPFQIYTNGCNPYNMSVIFHATQQNYELLSKLYPNVEFEPPPKRKEPKEVIKAMLESGWEYVPVIDLRDSHLYFTNQLDINRQSLAHLVPFDPKTGKTIIDFGDGEVVLESEND